MPTGSVESFWHAPDAHGRSLVLAWIPLTLGTAAGIAIQRQAFTDPQPRDAFIVLLLVPTAAALASLWWRGLDGIPMVFWTLLVIGSVFALVVEPTGSDLAPFFLVLYVGEAAVEGPKWRGVVALVGSVGVMAVVEVTDRFDGAYTWMLGVALAWVAGAAIRSVIDLVHELKVAQADLAARAAADERQRIAREVHDVVAHSLAVTMLHVTGARMALKRDPEEAADALHRAEALGRQSLAEVRRIVGLLRPDGTGTAPPLPGASDLTRLVEEFREAGLDVTLTVDGDLGRVAPTSGLALYRIAQESLTNVTKHAPAAGADVRVAVRNGRVRLVVVNDATHAHTTDAARDGGLGLPGMRDRATSLGGTLHADATDDGREWRVEAELPTTPA